LTLGHAVRQHFNHPWLDQGQVKDGLMELNGCCCPQLLRRYEPAAQTLVCDASTTAS
jgi:hypothetical protein